MPVTRAVFIKRYSARAASTRLQVPICFVPSRRLHNAAKRSTEITRRSRKSGTDVSQAQVGGFGDIFRTFLPHRTVQYGLAMHDTELQRCALRRREADSVDGALSTQCRG